MMPAELRLDQTCVVADCCLRPARELGGHCTRCWQGLAPFERELLQWEHAALRIVADTVPIPSREIAEVCDLEDLFDAPAFGEAAA